MDGLSETSKFLTVNLSSLNDPSIRDQVYWQTSQTDQLFEAGYLFLSVGLFPKIDGSFSTEFQGNGITSGPASNPHSGFAESTRTGVYLVNEVGAFRVSGTATAY